MALALGGTVDAGSKKLNEMNRLADMGHFPAAVNAGATLNVLLTLLATWWIEPRLPALWAPVAWVAVVLALNLLPVVVLRLALSPASTYPPLAQMDFWRDQHKFSDWVYVAASANMAFWVLTDGPSFRFGKRQRLWPCFWRSPSWSPFRLCCCDLPQADPAESTVRNVNLTFSA